MNARRASLLFITALGFAALTGCTAASAPDQAADASQSVEEACTIVADGMQELQGEMEGMATEMQDGDLSGLGEALDVMEDKLGELVPQVGNEEVKAVVEQMRDALADFTGSLEGADGDLTALANDEGFAQAGQSMQEAGTEFSTLCGGS